MKRMVWLAFVLGCGPDAGSVDGSDADSTGSPTTGGDPSTSTVTSPGTTTTATTSTTSTVTTTGVDTSSDDAATDECSLRFPDAGGAPHECDPWAEDCPCGQKCMPWANDGGPSWNALRCTPIADDPKQVGEPCTVQGSGVSGIDDCELHAMCFFVDPDTNMGTCVPMCTGTIDDPGCADECSTCVISGDSVLSLCLSGCDPIASDCAAGETCIFVDGDFYCAPDVSGMAGAIGDPCEYVNACDPGLLCAEAALLPGCTGVGCCTPFCLGSDAATCVGIGEGVECVPLPGLVPGPCQEPDLGACVLPEGG